MKQKEFIQNKKIILIFSIFLILIGSIKLSKNYISNNKNEFYETLSNGVELAYIVNGKTNDEIPSKGDYDVTVSCDNNTIGKWDYDKWGIVISNITDNKVKCTIDFKANLKSYIKTLSETDSENFVTDDTKDANIRYYGTDPDNYLCFDSSCTNGKWRVIGVMNNITTSTGTTTSLVKIIRKDSIGNNKWDSNSTNDWTNASLNTYLNEDWYNNNLTDYDDLVESVVWNLGGYSSVTLLASEYYTYERGSLVYTDRYDTWSGKIGLIYPSDYGYATGGGTTGRDTCLTYTLDTWGSHSDCYKNNFLYYSKAYQWTLMPDSSTLNFVAHINGGGATIAFDRPSMSLAVLPVLYLNSATLITYGNGTSDSPWIIGL